MSTIAKIIAIALLAAGLLWPVEAASAEEGCLHRAHYRKAARSALHEAPMSRREAHQMFGTRGRPIGNQTRVYQGCGEGSRAWVQFRRDTEGTMRVSTTSYTWRYFGDGLITLHPA